MRLLLLSNSTNHGQGFLDHAMPAILEFLHGTRELWFVPFALQDQPAYVDKTAARFAREGVTLRGLRADASGAAALEQAAAVFVGGGNTFRLLDALQRSGLQGVLQRRVLAGLPYLGSSAGSNVAAPSIRTTNDMPIVEPASFTALGLVRFQINPHYLDPDPISRHMGETRETRLREYLEENAVPVVGLREGAWLQVDAAGVRLEGGTARIFRRGREPEEVAPGALIEP